MKKLLWILLIILLGCSSTVRAHQITEVKESKKITFDPQSRDSSIEIPKDVYHSYHEFVSTSSSKLLQEIKGEANFVYSPMSFYLALAMLEPITFENSLEELYRVMQTREIQESAQRLIQSLSFNNTVGMSQVANSLWFQENVAFNRERLQTIADGFKAESLQVDFTDKTTTSKQINAWISNKTQNFIKDLQIEIDPQVVLALINTLYVKDAWAQEFVNSHSINDTFTTKSKQVVKTLFMRERSTDLRYVKTDDYQAVLKTLVNGGKVAFILPESESNTLYLPTWDQFQFTLVDLSVPKFDVSNKHDLHPVAQSLGLKDIFEPSRSMIKPFADDQASAFVSKISQQARLLIDEKGLEAAAYTLIETKPTSAPLVKEVTIKFDRPFQVVVYDPNGLVLFVGWINSIE